MRIWQALLGLLAPEKYLHNVSLRDSDAHERQRHATNARLAEQALEVARTGAAVARHRPPGARSGGGPPPTGSRRDTQKPPII